MDYIRLSHGRCSAIFLLVSLCICSYIAWAADAKRYALADRGYITLSVPSGWIDQVRRPNSQLPPTIVFRPASGAAFEVLVTPIWPARGDIPRITPEALRETVRRASEEARSQAVETELKLEDIRGPEAFGTYFSATDRAPKPGEYKYLTQGMLSLAELRVTFTILTNDGGASTVANALEMLRTAKRER